jgi:hypothetical protein
MEVTPSNSLMVTSPAYTCGYRMHPSDARAFLKSDQIRSMQAEQLRNGIADASTSAVFSER